MPPRTSMPEMLVSHTMKSHGKQQAQRNPAQHRYKCYRQGTVSSTVWTSAATGAVPSAAAFCTDRGLRMHPSALRSGNPESPGIPTSRHNMLPGFISLLLPGLRGSLSLSDAQDRNKVHQGTPRTTSRLAPGPSWQLCTSWKRRR